MRIITVMGDSDIGKTTTIKDALVKLLSKGAVLIFYKVIGADNQDFHAVVLWKSRVIALCSLGDSDDKNGGFEFVVEGLNLAKRYNADVLVNALSYSIKNGDKDETEKEYSVILNNTLRTAKYIPIEPCFFKSSVRKIIREIKKAEKNVLLCYKCLCCKCKKNIVKKDSFCIPVFPFVVLLIDVILLCVLKLFEKEYSFSLDVCFLVCNAVVMLGALASAALSLFLKRKNRKIEALERIYKRTQNDFSVALIPSATNIKEVVNAHSDIFKSYANAMADI